MTRPPAGPTSTAVQLLLVAEELFAAHGIEGVSLRQIAAAAGSANTSAVSYHFGSKSRLVAAILAHRIPELVQRRRLLAARTDPDDLRQRLEAHLLPLLELAEEPGGRYVSFVEQLRHTDDAPQLFAAHAEVQDTLKQLVADLHRLLPDVEKGVRGMRINDILVLSLQSAAERERAIAAQRRVTPFGLYVTTLIDGLTGYLTAPVSAETRALLARPKQRAIVAQLRLI